MQGLPVACGRGQMRLEAVVSKAQREQIRGTAEDGVGSAPVGCGRQHRAFFGSAVENFFQLAGLNQRNIRGDDECAVDAARYTDTCRHLNGAGFAGIRRVGNDFEIVLPREIDGERIAGYQRAGRTARPRGNCCYNVVQHGLRQLRARGLIENCGETLLGRRQILDRNEDHG